MAISLVSLSAIRVFELLDWLSKVSDSHQITRSPIVCIQNESQRLPFLHCYVAVISHSRWHKSYRSLYRSKRYMSTHRHTRKLPLLVHLIRCPLVNANGLHNLSVLICYFLQISLLFSLDNIVCSVLMDHEPASHPVNHLKKSMR